MDLYLNRCTSTYLKVISSGMPPNSVESRGQNFVKWIDKLRERAALIGAFEPENEPKNEECENIKPDDTGSVASCTQDGELKDVVDSETGSKVEVQPVIAGQEANDAL
jgi:hypothetical protein